MTSPIEIKYLADHPAATPVLARWHHAQWGYLNPGGSEEKRIADFQHHLGKRQIPITFVALEGETVLGSASMIEQDMDTRPELHPWLSSVYVDTSRRGSGVGTALVRRVMEEARAIGVKTLYLFTPDRESFYAQLGWQTIEKTEYRGEIETIMKYEFTPNS
ncbi:GNAT family N-acetyltransferase [Candidatus Sumerlaeota bacterium]|nr:GNAT family N-acetyltransferase [Candidatus Sumerlaeota bacterium]MBI3736610.1 GNAT family N-acetyltransferase [Candidatus Sumerlaeota bacterium]